MIIIISLKCIKNKGNEPVLKLKRVESTDIGVKTKSKSKKKKISSTVQIPKQSY